MDAGWEKRAEDLLDRFDLLGVADRVTAGFSHGMGRRMSVLLAAFHEPEVLLLDEPFDGVDPLGVEATMDVIARASGHRFGGPGLDPPARRWPSQACEQAVVLRRGTGGGRCPSRRARRPGGRRALPVAADLMSAPRPRSRPTRQLRRSCGFAGR